MKKNRIFSPLSIWTEFNFGIDKDKASELLTNHSSNIFEKIEITDLRDTLSCNVRYGTTIQQFGVSSINEIKEFEQKSLVKFLKRYSGLKNSIRKHGEIKIRTTVTFIGEINVK